MIKKARENGYQWPRQYLRVLPLEPSFSREKRPDPETIPRNDPQKALPPATGHRGFRGSQARPDVAIRGARMLVPDQVHDPGQLPAAVE